MRRILKTRKISDPLRRQVHLPGGGVGLIFIGVAACGLAATASWLGAGGRRWILYMVVGCLVTISLWTIAALRDTVGERDKERRAALLSRRRLEIARRLESMVPGLGVYGGASAAIAMLGCAGMYAQDTRQILEPGPFLLYVLISLFAVRAFYRSSWAGATVVSREHRDTKAVPS